MQAEAASAVEEMDVSGKTQDRRSRHIYGRYFTHSVRAIATSATCVCAPKARRNMSRSTGDFGRYLDDPWADPGFAREPVSEETEVVIVGGGFGGLLCGARLRAAGITDFRIVEKAADFGGTWY